MSNIDVLVGVCCSLTSTDGGNSTNLENNQSKRQRLTSYGNFEFDSYTQRTGSSSHILPLSHRAIIDANLTTDDNRDNNNDDDDDGDDYDNETSSISTIEIDNEERSAMELLAWQETQISRCIIDNTVNQALESYLALIHEADQAALAFAEPTPPNNNNNNNSDRTAANAIEESAISMAINEHGLLQRQDREQPLHSDEIDIDSGQSNSAQFFHSQINNTTIDNVSVVVLSSSMDSADHKSDKIIVENSGSNDDHDDGIGDNIQSDCIDNSTDHVNFMEAAIAVAIQKKGLASYR